MLALVMGFTAEAKPSINDVQGCQAVLDFVDTRLATVKKYDEADVKIARNALSAYNTFLQSEHIEPGLLAFTGGDKAKAEGFQTQIDAYKSGLVQAMDKRYAEPRIYTDQAVAIDGCYSKAPMDDASTPMMKEALETLVKLARQS